MGDVNYFGMREHSMFICYNDMIKLTYPVLLHDIIKDYYDDLKDYLDLDKIKNYDIYNLERICAERLDINPLKYIKKPDCSDEICDLLLKTFSEEMTHMYTESQFSNFGAKLYTVFPQDRIKDIYIYVEEPYYQVIIDCDVHFGKYRDKIKYLTGNFIEAVQKVPNRPTCYALNNIDYVQELILHQYIPYTEIILGELGCNYELDEQFGMKLKYGIDAKMMKEKVFKLGVTPLVELDKRHFSQIDMDEFK